MKYGFDNLVTYMEEQKRFNLLRKLIPKKRRKAATHLTKYEKMRLACEELGPTFIKFGQLLSNRSDVLPLELILELEKLQDNVPPLPGSIARKVVEKELKKSTEELFAWFEIEPFASASMAQVHRATLKGGEKVAVKVQRPGIKEIIIEDIRVMYTVAEILDKRVPSIRSFDPVGIVRSFEESILKELDFVHESVNATRFYNNFSGEDAVSRFIHVPKIFQNYTTSKVLILEFISGFKISKFNEMEANHHDRKLIAKNLALSYFMQIFDHGFFHADPHPGNIFVLKSGEICYLDFGMMGSILTRDIEIFGHIFLSVRDKDVKNIIRSLLKLSENVHISNAHELESDVNEFVQSHSVSHLHTNEMSNVLLELKNIIVKHDLKVPAHFFLLIRSMVTIEGVIKNLDPDINIIELAKPYFIRSIAHKYDPVKIFKKFFNTMYEFGSYMEDFPGDVKSAMRRINTGEIKVDLRHQGIDPLVHTIHRVTKQVVAAVVMAALIVCASITLVNDTGPLWGSTSSWSVIGFILAGILGFRVRHDFKRGDHDSWKGWKED